MTTYQEKKYDIIISNPPYIRFDEPIMDIVKNNEPQVALYAKENGLYYYRKILENITNITNDKFLICFEIGLNQSTTIVDIAKKYGGGGHDQACGATLADFEEADKVLADFDRLLK